MWALTEAAAGEASAEAEDAEMDELLDFARGLDFEKYMGDVEVQTMINQVKRRIEELEGMKDDDDFEEQAPRGENRPQVAPMPAVTLPVLLSGGALRLWRSG